MSMHALVDKKDLTTYCTTSQIATNMKFILFTLGLLHFAGSVYITVIKDSTDETAKSNCTLLANYSSYLAGLPSIIQNSTEVDFCFDHEILKDNLFFSGLKDISFIGHDSKIECPPLSDAGIEFHRVENLSLYNFNLINCSFSANITRQGVAFSYWFGMLINESCNMDITEISIENSRGKGLTIFNSNGVIHIKGRIMDIAVTVEMVCILITCSIKKVKRTVKIKAAPTYWRTAYSSTTKLQLQPQNSSFGSFILDEEED